MKWFVLFVLFSTPQNPAPHQREFGPMRTETMEACLKRRSSMQKFLDAQIKNRLVAFHVFCVQFDASGYEEGVDALIRKSGREG